MRVCDLKFVKIGLRIRSLSEDKKAGTVVSVDADNDDCAWIQWDGEEGPNSCFFGTDAENEIVE